MKYTYAISFSETEFFEEPLVDCNDDNDCPKILSHCNKYVIRPTPLGKKGYCVFPYCQSTINHPEPCPTIGNECTVGSLSGNCSKKFPVMGIRPNHPFDSCRYDTVLKIANCGKKEVKSDNLQHNTVGRWVDGPINILIDWE